MDKNFEKVAPIAFLYDRDTDHSKKVSKEIRKIYFEDKKLDNSSLSGLAQVNFVILKKYKPRLYI